MDFGWLIPLLSLLTLLAVAVFALISKGNIEDRIDSNAPKSTLAKDGPQGGVAFLTPQRTADKPHVEPVLE